MNRFYESKITKISMLIMHFLSAIALMIMLKINPADANVYVGIIIMISALPHIVIFLLGGGFKDKFKIPELVFFFDCIFLGIIFFIFKEIPLSTVCVVWGVFDIVRALYHLFDACIEIKHNKLEIMEMLGDGIELLFGVLLIVEKEHGITLHIIMMATSLIIIGTKFIIDFVNEIRSHKK